MPDLAERNICQQQRANDVECAGVRQTDECSDGGNLECGYKENGEVIVGCAEFPQVLVGKTRYQSHETIKCTEREESDEDDDRNPVNLASPQAQQKDEETCKNSDV